MSFLRLTPDEVAARKRRNLWLAAALVAFIVLMFATTVLRMKRNLDEAQAAHAQNAAVAASTVEPAGRVVMPTRPVEP